MVREEIGLNFRLDLKRLELEAVDEEAEIGCG